MRISNYEEKPTSSYGGLGRALLEKMGWSSGKGLGKNEDGMAEAIAPKKKDDAAGVGANGRYPWEEKLWEKSFSQALSKLNGICDSSSDSDGDSSSSDSGEDTPKKEVFGARDEVIRPGELSGRDGIAVSGSKAELMIAKELAKDKWGRWGGRDGKMARIALAEAKAAAETGRAPPPRSAFASGEGEESASGSDSEGHAQRRAEKSKSKKARRAAAAAAAAAAAIDEEEEEEEAGAKKKKKKKKKATSAKGDEADGEGGSAEAADAAAAGEGDASGKKRSNSGDDDAAGTRKGKRKKPDTDDADDAGAGAAAGAAATAAARGAAGGVKAILSQAAAWWANRFVHAGALEGLKEKKSKKRGFDEDDQENLYMKAHDSKVQGRLGLGVSSGSNPMKVAGARWKGTKVSFGEEKAADAGDEGPSGSGSGGDDEDPSTEAPQKARGKAKAEAAAAPAWDKVKWKAISEALLKEHGSGEAGAQGMKLSKLRSLAIARAVETLKIQGAGWEGAEAAFDSRVLKSSKFCVEGKRIRVLAAAVGDGGDDAADDATQNEEQGGRKKKKQKS